MIDTGAWLGRLLADANSEFLITGEHARNARFAATEQGATMRKMFTQIPGVAGPQVNVEMIPVESEG